MIEPSNRSTALRLIPRNIATAFICLGLMLPAFGQQPFQTLLVGVDHRTVTSLNGDWHYLVDQSPGHIQDVRIPFVRSSSTCGTTPSTRILERLWEHRASA